jgi:selenocysteine-specific elongation factor
VCLVVAADEGVMPQTREHVAACELLGLRRAVVAVTKLDRVGEEVAKLAGEEALELLGGRFEAEVAICSARTGEGVSAVRDAVRRALEQLGPPRPSTRARLSVDRVFSVRGAGTVVTGTLVEGKIAIGAPLFLVGAAGVTATSARGLHVHDHAVNVAVAPTRLAINLAGLPLEAVRRGDVVTDDKNARATKAIDVALRAEAALRRGMTAQVYIGTARTSARIEPLADPEGGTALARLRFTQPIVVLGGDRFVLRGSDVEGPAGAAPPRRRSRDKRRAVLAALALGDAAAAVRALVEEAAPRPFPREAFASRFPIAGDALVSAAQSLAHKGEIAAIKGHGWIAAARLADLAAAARRLTAEHHKKAPLDRGLPLETLRRKLADVAGAEAAEEAIRIATAKTPLTQAGSQASPRQKGEPIAIEGDIARLPSFGKAPVDQAVRGAFEAAAAALREAGLKGVSEFAVKEATGASPRDVKAILAKLVRDNIAVHTGDLWFPRAAFDDLTARVRAHLERAPRLSIAEFKELSGLGRKQAIVLLEQLDREGVTRREGDDRLLAR